MGEGVPLLPCSVKTRNKCFPQESHFHLCEHKNQFAAELKQGYLPEEISASLSQFVRTHVTHPGRSSPSPALASPPCCEVLAHRELIWPQ